MRDWLPEARYAALLMVLIYAGFSIRDLIGAPHGPWIAGLIALPASIIASRLSGMGSRRRPR